MGAQCWTSQASSDSPKRACVVPYSIPRVIGATSALTVSRTASPARSSISTRTRSGTGPSPVSWPSTLSTPRKTPSAPGSASGSGTGASGASGASGALGAGVSLIGASRPQPRHNVVMKMVVDRRMFSPDCDDPESLSIGGWLLGAKGISSRPDLGGRDLGRRVP